MDKKYIQLFTEIVHTAEILAEQVIEYDHEMNDEKGEKAAITMRDDYAKLYDTMRNENFDYTVFTKSEYAKLLVATLIVVNNIENRIKNEQKAVQEYKINIIPKLERIVNEFKENENENINEFASELFTISQKEN